MSDQFIQRPLVPVGSRADAEETAGALTPYADSIETATVVHVVEKAGGALDKASVEQREIDAQEMFSIVTDDLRETGVDVETEIRYGTDVAATIIDAAHERDATSILFTPREDSRWKKLLSGDVTHKLLQTSDVPILVLPDREESEE